LQIATNTTPFLAELFVATDQHGARHCVVVVKGTFVVHADGSTAPADAQEPFVFADQHTGDPGSTSIVYECDFVAVKPRVDVVVNGAVIAPQGRQVTRLSVGLTGPGIAKRIEVVGDRLWIEGPRGVQPSEPAPFVRMPLLYERAFGGSDHSHESPSRQGTERRNPVGVGFHLNGARESILGKPLPNLERPGALVALPSDKPAPIGLGVIGRGWQPRIGFAGTYDDAWLADTFPFLPKDFNERYFQSAPEDQQLDALRGDEMFACINMSEAQRFTVLAPGFEVPVRFHFDDRTESSVARTDTLILEPEAARIIVVGRARVRLGRKLNALREIAVGRPKRTVSPGKPRYRSLSELFAARRGAA
jgi:hypothetical protein